jgi:hypothetical protein
VRDVAYQHAEDDLTRAMTFECLCSVKRITRFDPAKELIYVDRQVEGPRATAPVRLVIDTAATETLIAPDVIDLIGYSPGDAEGATSVTSAIGLHDVRERRPVGVPRHDRC